MLPLCRRSPLSVLVRFTLRSCLPTGLCRLCVGRERDTYNAKFRLVQTFSQRGIRPLASAAACNAPPESSSSSSSSPSSSCSSSRSDAVSGESADVSVKKVGGEETASTSTSPSFAQSDSGECIRSSRVQTRTFRESRSRICRVERAEGEALHFCVPGSSWDLFVRGLNPAYPPRQRAFEFLNSHGVDCFSMTLRELQLWEKWLEQRRVYGNRFPIFPFDVTLDDKLREARRRHPMKRKSSSSS